MVKLSMLSKKRNGLGIECLLIAMVVYAVIQIPIGLFLTEQNTLLDSENPNVKNPFNDLKRGPRNPQEQNSRLQEPSSQGFSKPIPKIHQPPPLPVRNDNNNNNNNNEQPYNDRNVPPRMNKMNGKEPSKNEKNNTPQSTMHIVFSTSCHVQQDWQSYLFFFQAMAVGQQGTVTRIVSGCSPEEEILLTKEFQDKIAIMSENFLLHFTPEFGKQVSGASFWSTTKYWNKPFGLKHWLEHVFGYNNTAGITSTLADDDIVVLVDPDMLMQRPFVNYFPQFMSTLWIEPVRKGKHGAILDKVSHGKPMAQDYSFHDAWLRSCQDNLTHVVGPDSPVHNVTNEQAKTLYSAGPPYIATAKDMYQIAFHWAKFLPRIFDLFPQMMSEMYGYCMAAAHLQLKHQLAQGFMVSNAGVRDGEGWGFMEHVTDTACDIEQYKGNVPQVIHFCQRYSIGEFFLSKYKLPPEILSCDFPLLELPPKDYASYTNYSHYGDDSVIVWEGPEKRSLYLHAYMVCSLMPAINKAASFYKDHHCAHGEANYEETWNTFKAMKGEQEAAKK